jgi:RNA polymerase sigma factor (sigma-70 family)
VRPWRWSARPAAWGPQSSEMAEDAPANSGDGPLVDPTRPLRGRASLAEWLYAQSQAGRWRLARERFVTVLERSAKKRLTLGDVTPKQLEEFLAALHLEDLALATACADGCEAAWEHFYATFRGYLRTAAAAILRRDSGSAEACELADSLFAELYGLADGKGAERSLFRYFHGRSSLKTWLRAVLAQRHIDAIRAGRRFEDLGEEDGEDAGKKIPSGPQLTPPDPHRQRYVTLFTRALGAALDHIELQEKERLRLYYAEEKTLAEIGRLLGEHESSVSRHLERARRDLRQEVESILRRGFVAANGSAAEPGLSDAEIALCFEYSAADTPIDLEKLLPRPKPRGPADGKRPV